MKILNNIDISPNSINLSKQIKRRTSSLEHNSLVNMSNNVMNKTEKENLYLRVSKRGEITDKTKPLFGEINLDCNSSFVELILTTLTKEIFKEKDFLDLFNNNIENQPLSLYKWTTNTICSTLPETRKKYLKKLKETINKYLYDTSSQVTKRL